MKRKRQRKPIALKRQIFFFILSCWIVPTIIFSAFFVYTYRHSHFEKTEALIASGMRNSAELVTTRINDAITDIQLPSYQRTWEDHVGAFERGQIEKHELYQYINASLKEKYFFNKQYVSYAFYLDGTKEVFCYGSNRVNDLENFHDMIEPNLHKYIDDGSNYTNVAIIDKRIFLIRNLYTVGNYEKFGSFVVELNMDKLMKNTSLNIPADCILMFNNENDYVSVERRLEDTTDIYALRKDIMKCNEKGYNVLSSRDGEKTLKNKTAVGYFYQEKEDKYTMGMGYIVDYYYVYQNFEQLFWIVGILMAIFVPFLGLVLIYMQRQILGPVQRLMSAFHEVRDGKIGTTCQGYKMPNKEFADLIYAFNNMSLQVKYLFDTVYSEKLERKDAQIAALQSQINPHFLNNTLEMMNWQARMNNDIEVSKMIEALGILLDYRTNRENNTAYYLSEEMRCSDAYLYIMSMRFGQRLTIVKEVDPSILRTEVPQLILQPILENAITHGIEKVKSGEIKIHVYHEGESVYLDVINTSNEMTPEHQEKINQILNGTNEIKKQKGQHVSIGIRNVNRRIKLLYGEQYGLTITKLDETHVLSRISLPMHELNKGRETEQRVPEETYTREEELEQVLNVLNRN